MGRKIKAQEIQHMKRDLVTALFGAGLRYRTSAELQGKFNSTRIVGGEIAELIKGLESIALIGAAGGCVASVSFSASYLAKTGSIPTVAAAIFTVFVLALIAAVSNILVKMRLISLNGRAKAMFGKATSDDAVVRFHSALRRAIAWSRMRSALRAISLFASLFGVVGSLVFFWTA